MYFCTLKVHFCTSKVMFGTLKVYFCTLPQCLLQVALIINTARAKTKWYIISTSKMQASLLLGKPPTLILDVFLSNKGQNMLLNCKLDIAFPPAQICKPEFSIHRNLAHSLGNARTWKRCKLSSSNVIFTVLTCFCFFGCDCTSSHLRDQWEVRKLEKQKFG